MALGWPVSEKGPAPGIDYHQLHFRPGTTRFLQAAVQHRVGPGGVGAGQYHQVRQFQILVAAWHHILAEGTDMGGHRRGHAQTGIGIDIGAAEKTLPEFIGDVVVLSQQLPGEIERHALRPVLTNGVSQPLGQRIQRAVPVTVATVDARAQQASLVAQGLVQGGALDAEPSGIGRVLSVSRHLADCSHSGHPWPSPCGQLRCAKRQSCRFVASHIEVFEPHGGALQAVGGAHVEHQEAVDVADQGFVVEVGGEQVGVPRLHAAVAADVEVPALLGGDHADVLALRLGALAGAAAPRT
jgi:hypothetical protein